MGAYSEFLDFTKQLALDAGAVLMDWYETELALETKSSEFDIVTAADRAAEELILGRIREHYPRHAILAEESGSAEGDEPYLWIVDPLDGTTNFANAFPHFCVSIALQHEGEIAVGAIYDPVRDELFWAARGEGAWLKTPRGQHRLRVSTTTTLSAALLATGFAYSRATTATNNLNEFQRLVLHIRGIRRAGSAALDVAYVAAGRLDGYWEYHMQPWDTAAGALMVVEAGGVLRQINGEPWDPWRLSTVAANPTLLKVLLDALQGTVP
jgi:myo-inositol-1(or 4)-monophosphatase